ncbi:OmpH family outer membrane protein [Dyadobacter sp. CY261]|uniref:OmpH family outer membrane protein n=1 Tax=Dyadobacter sp. CY261 TaxID=2907203 RepID=UPI001F1F8021|nr:OmpH family outer membrane protein [Dyadobacter sp. CY261]MCF0074910.1 OmpH family outer membrane protein [Dyadobacter sp. CY261]
MTRALFFLLALSVVMSTNAFCQKNKIGTVDLEYVYANLPSHKKLLAEIDSSSSRYQKVQKEKLAEYQQKLQAYQKLDKQTPEPVLKDKANELETLQAAIQQFQENADKDLRTKYANKFPEIERLVKAAIAECATELQVTYVARNSADYSSGESMPFLIYSSDTQTDLTDQTLAKLGVASHPEKGKNRKSGIIK